MDCISSCGCKELDTTERLSLHLTIIWVLQGGARVENMREGVCPWKAGALGLVG